jgi:hypothetical protein
MKKHLLIFVIAGCLLITPFLKAGESDMTKIFPEIKDMTKGKPDMYTPDNLYEYINGAAEIFLSYDFQQLAAITYENPKKHSITIDVYRHSDARNGFGIYSQEKPTKGDFLQVGAQGYYEKGVFNFVKGSYYVKMSGFDLGDNDKSVLTAAAKDIARRLKGQDFLPLPVTCFPGKGMIENSEKYISQNFLGHSFLHSAFIAEYEETGEKFKIFIIQAADKNEANKIKEDYFKFAKSKNSEISVYKTFFRFLDPYYRSNGKMNIETRGKYAFGLFGDNMKRVRYYMEQMKNNLERLHTSL